MKISINICIDIDGATVTAQVNGRPLGIDVPDEKTPPPEEVFDPSQLAEPYKKHSERHPNDAFNKIMQPMETRGRKPIPPAPHRPSYISIIDLGSKDPELLGCQATANKFIVNHAYFQGRLDNARGLYRAYLDDMKKAYKEAPRESKPDILAWGSWLILEYPKLFEKLNASK